MLAQNPLDSQRRQNGAPGMVLMGHWGEQKSVPAPLGREAGADLADGARLLS
jgi:hypothetical protein